MRFKATEADAGRRVESALARRMPDAPWGHVQKLLRQGRVQLDGATAQRGAILTGNEEVVVRAAVSHPPPPPMPNRRIRFQVRHEDADLAVVVKPAPLPMHPGPGHGTDTFLNALVGAWPEMLDLGPDRAWGLVHRLDAETSGLLVVARSAAGYDGLAAAFRDRRVAKEYLALVSGRPDPESGAVDRPIEGKDARTEYVVAETAGGVSLVRARPVTGRNHQIRIHLAGLGCPVLHDPRHGTGRDEITARLYLGRLALHAHRLAFDHPSSGRELSFEEPFPRDLKRAWRRAQHDGSADRTG